MEKVQCSKCGNSDVFFERFERATVIDLYGWTEFKGAAEDRYTLDGTQYENLGDSVILCGECEVPLALPDNLRYQLARGI